MLLRKYFNFQRQKVLFVGYFESYQLTNIFFPKYLSEGNNISK